MTAFLTPTEAARILRVSHRTLANWRYKDTGPSYIRQGRCVRYTPAALDAWAEQNGVSRV